MSKVRYVDKSLIILVLLDINFLHIFCYQLIYTSNVSYFIFILFRNRIDKWTFTMAYSTDIKDKKNSLVITVYYLQYIEYVNWRLNEFTVHCLQTIPLVHTVIKLYKSILTKLFLCKAYQIYINLKILII